MSCEVLIPAPLQSFTGGKKRLDVRAGSVRAVLQELGARHEGLLERICQSGGELRSFVNVYVNNTDIRSLDGLDTPVTDGDEILLVPAIAGG